MEIVAIKGIIKDYPWGNDYFIPGLLGIRKGGIMAEYWLGTHPSGDAFLSDGTKLSDYISSDLEGALGPDNASRYNHLPLLLKILAVGKPLSLQCHPDKAQAIRGWKEEEGVRRTGGICNYQDDNEKAELLYALTPLTALCGFLPLGEIIANLKRYVPSSYESFLSSFSDEIGRIVFRLYSLSPEQKHMILEEFKKNIAVSSMPVADGSFLTLRGVAEKCMDEHPGDIGIIFTLLMNIVHLSPGEALYMKPDTMHAYVSGNAVELMDASDNVLRGGLTRKRCDVDELMRIMDTSTLSIEKIVPSSSCGVSLLRTPSDTFTLARMEKGVYEHRSRTGIVLVLDGSLSIRGGGELDLGKGEAAFIPYSSECTLDVDGVVFEALIP